MPMTPAKGAMRVTRRLSTRVFPSRSQGNPEILARASSTATQANGAKNNAPGIPNLERLIETRMMANKAW